MGVLREDVVKITYDTESFPAAEIDAGVKQAVSAAQEASKAAQDAISSVKEVGSAGTDAASEVTAASTAAGEALGTITEALKKPGQLQRKQEPDLQALKVFWHRFLRKPCLA